MLDQSANTNVQVKTPQTVKEMIPWLQRLNRPPLPECPIEAATEGKEPKAPHFIDGNYVKSIQWKTWQKTMPPPKSLKKWFKSPEMGIGTLGGFNGKHWLCWVDFDAKDFESPEACDKAVREWEQKYWLNLEHAPMFRTPSGGYRYLVAFETEPEGWGANNGFSLSADGLTHAGELLTKQGGHTLLPPTMGLNGKRYEWVRWFEYPPVVSCPEDLGLYLYKKPQPEGGQGNKNSTLQGSNQGRTQGSNSGNTDIRDFLLNEVYLRLNLEQCFNWLNHDFKECDGGAKLQGNCPWHESDSGTAFYCEFVNGIPMYRCPVDGGGDLIEYRYRVKTGNSSDKPQGKDFIEIAKELAAEAGVLDKFPSFKKFSNSSNKPPHKRTPRAEYAAGETNESDEPIQDPNNPDSIFHPICLRLNLIPENCVTYSTFESWVYNHKFGSGNDWISIDSAYYKWDEAEHIWKHQTDNKVLQLVAESGKEAYKLKKSKEFDSWVTTKPYESNSHKEAAFKYNRNRLEVPGDYLSQNLHLLAFDNCVVDLRTGEQLQHSKEHYLTNRCPYDYQPNKPCPEVFRNFVIDSFGEEALEVIRAFTSMFLDPTAPFFRVPHLIGKSGGGKGTLIRFWGSLFGPGGTGSGTSFADISTPEGRHQYLTGKRIFLFPDMGGFTAGLKAFYELVDNGGMTGRALFNPVGYEKKWNMRFALASVDYLQVENSGDGWARRVYPLPVKNRNVIPDTFLGKKLEEVKAEIISWALSMNREERDTILTSPPTYEGAIMASLNAALHGDSTKSFVDLCLRPASEPSNISNDLLHELYKAYCKPHGYSAAGMSKFISHLKTVLPYNFVDRSWTPMKDGKRERIKAHWEYIHIPPEIFKTIGLNSDTPDSHAHHNPEWVCVKSQCQEGGLLEFEEFWNPDSSKTPEPSIDKGVQGVQGENSTKKDPGQAEILTESDCPKCPTVQGESSGIEKGEDEKNSGSDVLNVQTPPGQIGHPGHPLREPVSGDNIEFGQSGQVGQPRQNTPVETPLPQDVDYNVNSLQFAIREMSWEMISELTQLWTEAMKQAVWKHLSNSDKKKIKDLDPKTHTVATNNNVEIASSPQEGSAEFVPGDLVQVVKPGYSLDGCQGKVITHYPKFDEYCVEFKNQSKGDVEIPDGRTSIEASLLKKIEI